MFSKDRLEEVLMSRIESNRMNLKTEIWRLI